MSAAMLFNGIERRKHPREECVDCMDLNIRLDEHDEIVHGVCMNKSDGGLCVFTPLPLAEDQLVEFKENLTLSPKKAVVKWNRLYFKQFYKSGIMLTA
jgi:hypothetical protein